MLWKKFFPDNTVRIILNTESKTYHLDGLNIECFKKFRPEENVLWGKRLNEHLKEITTPFVLPMLDDFFLFKEVDLNRILQIIEWMKADSNIAAFYFTNSVSPYDTPSIIYPGFSEKSKVCPYKINTMGSLWKTEKLLKFSLPNTTPWEWEYYGSVVAFDANEKFFAVNKDNEPVLSYIYPIKMPDGSITKSKWGIVRGKWVVEAVDALFKENGIYIDYSKRGVLDINDNMQSNVMHFSKLENIVGKRIAKEIKNFERKNRVKKLFNLPVINDYAEYKARIYNNPNNK